MPEVHHGSLSPAGPARALPSLGQWLWQWQCVQPAASFQLLALAGHGGLLHTQAGQLLRDARDGGQHARKEGGEEGLHAGAAAGGHLDVCVRERKVVFGAGKRAHASGTRSLASGLCACKSCNPVRSERLLT